MRCPPGQLPPLALLLPIALPLRRIVCPCENLPAPCRWSDAADDEIVVPRVQHRADRSCEAEIAWPCSPGVALLEGKSRLGARHARIFACFFVISDRAEQS